MKKLLLLCLALSIFLSCSSLSNSLTLSQTKEGLSCIGYTTGIPWEQVQQAFGIPPLTPRPEPGADLSRNARGYKNLEVFFYTQPQKIEEGDKIRFKEVVYKVEICKKK